MVGCGNTFGNLIRFASASERSFRFYVEIIGNTVFLVRKESSPTELIEGVRGYGHTFPEAYTSWEKSVKNSVSHQRLIEYTFGGLKCLFRYEGDGYFKDQFKTEVQESSVLDDLTETHEESEPEPSLTAGSLTVSERAPEKQNGLVVKLAGHKVPQCATFELKTRSSKREYDMEEIYARLWISQTQHFIIGYHESGKFNNVRIRNVAHDVKDWESRNKKVLQTLKATLRRIIEVLKESKSNKLEVRRLGSGPLQFRKQCEKQWSVLPSDLRQRWLGRPAPASTSKAEESDSSDEEFDDDSYLQFE